MCGVASMGLLLDHSAIAIPSKTDIKALTVQKFDKFFSFTSRPIAALKAQLKTEQQYNANIACLQLPPGIPARKDAISR
jgi:hypothetical protein